MKAPRMKRKTSQRGTLLLLAALALGIGLFPTAGAAARPGVEGKAKGSPVGPALAAFQTRITTGNRVELNLSNNGHLAVDPSRGPVTPGGFWPSGSEDAYIYHEPAARDGNDRLRWRWDRLGCGRDQPGVRWRVAGGPSRRRPGRSEKPPVFLHQPADLAEWPAEFMITDNNPAAPRSAGRSRISAPNRISSGSTRMSTAR